MIRSLFRSGLIFTTERAYFSSKLLCSVTAFNERNFFKTRSVQDFSTLARNLSLSSLLCQTVVPFSSIYWRAESTLSNTKLEHFLKNLNDEVLKLKFHLKETHAVFTFLEEKQSLEENLKQLQLLKDNEGGNKHEDDMMELINDDIQKYTIKLHDIYEKILECLLPKGDFEECNDIVLEISAGVGGLEAMLFASELRNMYCSYLKYKGWQYLVAENEESDLGGVRHCSLLITGRRAYSILEHEAGVHRVQRVPTTERGGRVHTSTVTVAVLPQPSDVDVKIKDTDLKIDTKRASGAGGQHVNTTDSAVRITHLPTGTVVECQSGRNQHQNKLTALKSLKAKIYEKELNQIDSTMRSKRKSQVGTSGRSEKIRTYNFRDDRISDHRLTANIYNMKDFLQGGESLDKLFTLLDRWQYEHNVQQFVNNLPS